MLKLMANINIVHIPYKDVGPALTDLMGGQIEIGFNNVLSALPHVRSGRLRALAVTSKERSKVLPQLPTVAESGEPGLREYEASVWYAVLVPALRPAAVINRLHSEFVKTLQLAKVQERITDDGAPIVGSTPEVLVRVIQSDLARWRRVIRETGIRLDIPR